MKYLALVAALWGGAAIANTACVDGLCYTDKGGSTGYDHAILGSLPEWREVTFQGSSFAFKTGFIEDTAPRIADVDGDGKAWCIRGQIWGRGLSFCRCPICAKLLPLPILASITAGLP